MAKTTISIEEETRDRLADIGKKRETYDTILNEIIDFYLEKM
jgi:predicted DNA-binding protein